MVPTWTLYPFKLEKGELQRYSQILIQWIYINCLTCYSFIYCTVKIQIMFTYTFMYFLCKTAIFNYTFGLLFLSQEYINNTFIISSTVLHQFNIFTEYKVIFSLRDKMSHVLLSTFQIFFFCIMYFHRCGKSPTATSFILCYFLLQKCRNL